MTQSVARLLTVVEHMASIPDGMCITDGARELGIPPASLHRLLKSLQEAGWAYQGPQQRYHLTLRVAALAAKVLERLDIRTIAKPLLESLGAEVQETVHLGILEGNEVVYVEKIEGPRMLRMQSRIGQRVSAHSTALGKVLLAALPEPKALQIIGPNGLIRHTSNTITDPIEFVSCLREVRANGYAIDNEENEPGIRCVAAPIVDHTGQVVAALSISGSIVSVDESSLDALASSATQTARAISSVLGYDRDDVGEAA